MREFILSAQAAAYLQLGDHVRAANVWAMTGVPLEQVVLRFSGGALTPLRHYLSGIVDRVDEANPSHCTLLCAWVYLPAADDNPNSSAMHSTRSSLVSAAPAPAGPSNDPSLRQRKETATTRRVLPICEDGVFLFLDDSFQCVDWSRVVAWLLERADADGALGLISHLLASKAECGNESQGDAGALGGNVVSVTAGAVLGPQIIGCDARDNATDPIGRVERLVESNARLLMSAAPRKTADLLLRLVDVDPMRLIHALMANHKTWQQCSTGCGGLYQGGHVASTGNDSSIHEGLRYLSQVGLPLLDECTRGGGMFEMLLHFHSALSDDVVLNSFLTREAPRAVASFAYCERTLTQYGRHEAACVLLQEVAGTEAAVSRALVHGLHERAWELVRAAHGDLQPLTTHQLWLATLLRSCTHLAVHDCMRVLSSKAYLLPTRSGKRPTCQSSGSRCLRQVSGQAGSQGTDQESCSSSVVHGDELPSFVKFGSLLPDFICVSELKEFVCTELSANIAVGAELRRGLEEGVARSSFLTGEICAFQKAAKVASYGASVCMGAADEVVAAETGRENAADRPASEIRPQGVCFDAEFLNCVPCAQPTAPMSPLTNAMLFPCGHLSHRGCCRATPDTSSLQAENVSWERDARDSCCLLCGKSTVWTVGLGFLDST